MNIQTLILGFLMKRSMTGYELKNAFSLSFSFFSGFSYGSIYPALKRMEQEPVGKPTSAAIGCTFRWPHWKG